VGEGNTGTPVVQGHVTATDRAETRRRRAVVAALMLAMGLAALDATIVSTAVPQIVGDLGGFSVFSWLFSGYLLAVTVTLPVYGKLSDTFGRKPVLVAGASLFAESAPPALWLLLSGEIALSSSTSQVPIRGRGGDIIGALEMLGGQPLGLAARVVESGIALRIARDDLFEVLGERPELLRQIFASMFRRAAGPAFASGVFRPKATQSSIVDAPQVGV